MAQALFSETGWIDGKRAHPENLEKRLQKFFHSRFSILKLFREGLTITLGAGIGEDLRRSPCFDFLLVVV